MYQGKYIKLYDYLSNKNIPKSITLSFEEIESILHFKLPNSSYKYNAWWANEIDGKHTHARSWLYAGWETSNIQLGKEVTFNKGS